MCRAYSLLFARACSFSGVRTVDWLSHHNHGDPGVTFASKKKAKTKNYSSNCKKDGEEESGWCVASSGSLYHKGCKDAIQGTSESS